MVSNRFRKNMMLLCCSVIIPMMVAEIFFRVNGKYQSFNEMYGKGYSSIYESPDGRGWYHIYPPHQITSQALKEYSYSIRANNEGLLDKDFMVHKAAGTCRILVIGDSFIQGMGAPVDSTCPKQLEIILKNKFKGTPNVEVWNCGVGNSDPVYEYLLLKDKLIKYQPDFVIEEVNNTDITDIISRGGPERFKVDSTVEYKGGPWFEIIYANSYIFRRIIHDIFKYNWQLLSPGNERKEWAKSITLLDSSLLSFQKLCDAQHIPLLVSFIPFKDEARGRSTYSMTDIIQFCNSNEIHEVDFLSYLKKNGAARDSSVGLYWPIDAHLNGTGYSRFAECLSTPVAAYIDTATRFKIPAIVQ